MKMPYLKSWDNIPLVVTFTDGLGENGEPNVAGTYEGKCNYSEKSSTIRTPDGQLVRLNAVLTVGSDIAPELSTLQGSVSIAGKDWKIYSGSRGRNPDGTVHHTKLELI